ncbi:hypothetical protein OF83DRAFT_1061668 [Amylostereum chailletii]|nr:hypothetical protein OF83DRAFT_1061668 [Amylostereum chailletii]
MAARGVAPAPAAQKRSNKTESLNHLLNFTLPPRQTHQLQSIPRRSRRNGTQQVWNKERFVNAQYRFVMNPEGDYTVHFADPDIFFQWQDILQIIIPRSSALASAAGGDGPSQEEGHTSCPICLSPPTAPRMTKCGHVFCFPCILHYLHTSDNTKWVRCPICFDSVNERQLKSVHWYDGPRVDEDADLPQASSSSGSVDVANLSSPRLGSTFRMRLMQRPQITTLALPRSPTWPSDLLPPHQAPFHFLPDVYPFSKFMLATPSYLVDNLNRDLADLASERRTLKSLGDELGLVFVDTAEQKLNAQIAKATALDTEPLRNAVDKALQMQHAIESRSAAHQQRKRQEQDATPVDPADVPEAYLATRAPSTPLPTPPPARNPKQRKNLNPPPPSTSTYYYYQAASGMPVFLHPLDIKILNAHFNGYASFPDSISVRVEASNEGSVNDDLRRRCKYLAHMPEGADVVFVEADLEGVVGADGLRSFETALKARRARRENKGRKDERARVKAEEREREKLAQTRWQITGTYVPPAPVAYAPDEFADDQEETRSPPPPASVPGAWGSRSFASALHTGPSTGGRAPARSARREDVQDEWDLDFAWHEMEQRAAGGRRKKSRPMVVLGNGPGRRR